MEVFGRRILSADEMDALLGSLMHSDETWDTGLFADASRALGFKRVARRVGYFSFSVAAGVTGQALFVDDLIEEIRMFVGTEPRRLGETQWNREAGPAAREVTAQYLSRFVAHFGPSRIAFTNHVWTPGDFTIRLLPQEHPPVWVVVSRTSIQTRIGRDPW
jgi:hypothetical protein